MNERWRRLNANMSQSQLCHYVSITMCQHCLSSAVHIYSTRYDVARSGTLSERRSVKWERAFAYRFPKQAKVDTGHQCFSVVAQATPQDSPTASPMAVFKWKHLMIGQLNQLLEWMLNESWRRLSMLSSTCQRLATLQIDSCAEKDSLSVEQSWWPEFHILGSMPWSSFPWHKLLPRLTQKNCYTIYSLNLIHDHEFTSTYIYIRVFNQPALCRLA